MAKRPRTIRRGAPVVQWTTRNLPTATLAELRACAALTEALPAPSSVEAIANMALDLGLPMVRRAIAGALAQSMTKGTRHAS